MTSITLLDEKQSQVLAGGSGCKRPVYEYRGCRSKCDSGYGYFKKWSAASTHLGQANHAFNMAMGGWANASSYQSNVAWVSTVAD
jgi:hypothetical protein